MNKRIFITGCILFLSTFMLMLGLWGIDIVMSFVHGNAILTNGFYIRNPIIHYHLSLYCIILAFTLIVINALWLLSDISNQALMIDEIIKKK